MKGLVLYTIVVDSTYMVEIFHVKQYRHLLELTDSKTHKKQRGVAKPLFWLQKIALVDHVSKALDKNSQIQRLGRKKEACKSSGAT